MLKLPEYARRMGISRSYAFALYSRGELPHPATKIGPRTILVDVPVDFGTTKGTGKTAVYLRVSSQKQKDSMAHQRARVLDYCASKGFPVDVVIEEIASGMNGNRKKLLGLLADEEVSTIVVEHRERLARINYELIEAVLGSRGAKIVVIDEEEIEDDLVRDVTEVLTSMCARFYGKRSARLRAQQVARELVPDEFH